MKKTVSISALIACSLFSTLFAATTQAPSKKCCPAPVSVSNPIGGKDRCVSFKLYADYLLLQPNGSHLYYAVEAVPVNPSIPNGFVSPNWTIYEISPDYESGFKVGSSALFNKTDFKLDLNWQRVHGQDSAKAHATAPLSSIMMGPFFDIGPNSIYYKQATGHSTSHFDGVNLDFGKQFRFANGLNANVYAGVGFTRIQQSLQSYFSNTDNTTSREVYTASTFTGAGPQAGLDFDCRMFNHFYFNGSTSFSLLMGQLKNNTVYQSRTPILAGLSVPQPNTQGTTVPNRSQLVPACEQKVGFTYLAKFDCCKANFGIGYQCQIYMNAIQTVDMTSQVLPALAAATPDVGVFAVGFTRTLSNFMLTGPYLEAGIEF